MTILGYNSTPPDAAGADVGRIIVSKVGPIPAGGGVLNSISTYINAPNANWGEFKGLLYADNAGAPGALVAQTANFFGLPDSTPAWKTANTTTNPTLIAGAYYWVGVQVEHDSMTMYIDTGVAGDTYQIDSGTFGTVPDPFGTPSTIRTDYIFAAHLDYTAGAAPVISAATPSVTIGTSTTATVGFTTDTAGGSAVGIIDIPARTAGITAAQIKAGHNNLDAAPIAVLSSMTPVSGVNSFAETTGLTANTGYSQAVVQTVSSVDSNVLIGSFTTAAATTSVTVGFNSDASTVLANTAMKFWTKNTLDGAVVDGGSGGISGTTDASGNITLTGLTITAGAKWLQYQVGSDTLNIHIIPVTYA